MRWLLATSVACAALLQYPVGAAPGTQAFRSASYWERTQEILARNNYNPMLPPTGGPPPRSAGWAEGPSVVTVQLGLNLQNIQDIDVMKGSVTLHFWLRLKWLDPRLLYNGTEEFGRAWAHLSRKGFPAAKSQIWVPDIILTSSLRNVASDFLDTMATVFDEDVAKREGHNIFWSRPGTVQAKCDTDSSQFPFDDATCVLRFESWIYDGNHLVIVPMEKGFSQTDDMPVRDEFELIRQPFVTRRKKSSYNAAMGGWSSIEIGIKARRVPRYYVIHAIIPLALLLALTALSTWFPLDSRAGLQLTLLLTVFANMLFTAGKQPMLGHDTWLDRFQTQCVFLIALPLVWTAFFVRWPNTIAIRTPFCCRCLVVDDRNDGSEAKAVQGSSDLKSKGHLLNVHIVDKVFRHLFSFFAFVCMWRQLQPVAPYFWRPMEVAGNYSAGTAEEVELPQHVEMDNRPLFASFSVVCAGILPLFLFVILLYIFVYQLGLALRQFCKRLTAKIRVAAMTAPQDCADGASVDGCTLRSLGSLPMRLRHI